MNINEFINKLKKCKTLLKLQNINLIYTIENKIYYEKKYIIINISINNYFGELFYIKLNYVSNILLSFYLSACIDELENVIMNKLCIHNTYLIDDRDNEINNISKQDIIDLLLNIKNVIM